MRIQRFAVVAITLTLLAAAQVAHAKYVSLKTYELHGFDVQLLKLLGFDEASILYYGEMASITQEQLVERRDYERIGCQPFLILKNGKTEEKGYDCKSFMCVGYQKGPKQCLSHTGEPYGGVVEIARRQSLITIEDVRRNFADFPLGDQTDEIRKKIAELTPVRCTPFYLMMFDVLVGEGYECREVGTFPYFSPANTCVDTWRDPEGLVCKLPQRADEFARRREAIELRGGGFISSSSSSVSLASSTSSASSGSTVEHSASASVLSFPDVVNGRYGYTAITDLAARGVVQGYPDGTFRPKSTINRAEFVHMLLNGLHEEQLVGEMSCFPDVENQWYAPAVCAAKRLGWVLGYRDGLFRPQQTLRRDEGLKIVVASLGLPLDSQAPLPPDVADDTWFTPYARKAMELRMILESTFRPMHLATRADAAVWMFRALRGQSLLSL